MGVNIMADHPNNDTNDTELDLPYWKQRYLALKMAKGVKDIADENDKDYLIKEDEVALKHPTLDSMIKLTDEGYIDIFASPTLGIRVDPKTQSINFFGDQLNFFSKNMNIVTKPTGLTWNKYQMNPSLYAESSTEKEQYLSGTKNYWVHDEEQGWHWERREWSIPSMVKNTSKTRYSDSMIQIMKSLGLPTE
jgi:hypothetical protein